MEQHKVKVLETSLLTHNVRRIKTEKPAGYSFTPGQATEVAINSKEWKDARRPFTFTSLNEWPHLEFVIKVYDAHGGVTQQVGRLKPGDELLIHDVWGAISYKGPGVFIAAGAGITPFIAILRDLHKKNALAGNSLIFSNRTYGDIILREELEKMLGNEFLNVLTREKAAGLIGQRISRDFLKKTVSDFSQHFYVCGPEEFTNTVAEDLSALGASTDTIVFEK